MMNSETRSPGRAAGGTWTPDVDALVASVRELVSGAAADESTLTCQLHQRVAMRLLSSALGEAVTHFGETLETTRVGEDAHDARPRQLARIHELGLLGDGDVEVPSSLVLESEPVARIAQWARESWSRLAPREDSWAEWGRALGVWSAIPGRVFERGLAGGALELDRQRAGRRQRGVFYTPAGMADALVAGVCDTPGGRGDDELPTICDPACGGGALLLAAARRWLIPWRAADVQGPVGLARWRAATGPRLRDHLFGADLDPVAVEACAQSLWLLAGAPAITGGGQGPRMVTADAVGPCEGFETPHTEEALRQRWGQLFHRRAGDGLSDVAAPVAFDRVVLNPPYVDAESMTRHQPTARREISRRFSTARGNWDLFVPFVELALALTREGGQLHALLPTTALAAPYAAQMQRRILGETLVGMIEMSEESGFDGAEVEVVGLEVRRAAPPTGHRVRCVRAGDEAVTIEQSILGALPGGGMGFPLSGVSVEVLGLLAMGDRLQDIGEVSDGATTAEAYEIARLVSEEEAIDGAPHVRLVNTGTIDPMRLLWGTRPTRYLGRRLARPVVAVDDLQALTPRRAWQASRWSVVVAGLSRSLEAAVAPPGILCGKSAVVLVPDEQLCCFALAAWLNTEPVRELYRGLFGARGFGRGSVSVGPRQLRQIPVPSRAQLLRAPEPPDDLLNLDSATPARRWLDRLNEGQRLSGLGQLLCRVGVDATALWDDVNAWARAGLPSLASDPRPQ